MRCLGVWKAISDFPESGWVFVLYDDYVIEYGKAVYGQLDIGGTKFELDGALAWCEAPKPNKLIELG